MAENCKSVLIKTKSEFIYKDGWHCLHMLVSVCGMLSPPIKTVPQQSNPSEYSIGYVPINKLSQTAVNVIDPLINS